MVSAVGCPLWRMHKTTLIPRARPSFLSFIFGGRNLVAIYGRAGPPRDKKLALTANCLLEIFVCLAFGSESQICRIIRASLCKAQHNSFLCYPFIVLRQTLINRVVLMFCGRPPPLCVGPLSPLSRHIFCHPIREHL